MSWLDDEKSMEYSKHEEGYLWKRISELFPSMADEDVWALIKVFKGTCPYCRNAPTGCQCWNDD